MERRHSYSRLVYAPTSAARVASVKNNRETLLLAKASKGLSHESDGTLRTFYREKARTSNFLQKVHGKSTAMLKAELEKNGQLATDDGVNDQKISVITRSEAREAIKGQRMRRISLDISQSQETQRRIQEFLARDIPGASSSRNKQVGQVGGFNVADEFKEMSLKESSADGSQTQGPAQAQKLFRVRSRASGICFSCCRCHLQRLPSESMPNIATKYSVEYPWKSTETKARKLNVPVMVSKMSPDQNRRFDVSTLTSASTGSDKTSAILYKTRTNRLKSAPIKKHSV